MIVNVIIMALFCVLGIISGYYAYKPLIVIEKNQIKETTKESLLKVITEIAKNMRIYEKNGNGVKYATLYRTILKTYKCIVKKVERDLPIEESEKWLYENFYLIYRFIFSKTENMRNLPHCDGIPRIIHIARAIVNNSLGDLNQQRVNFILSHIKNVVPLNYKEISAFKFALGYAILEQTYIWAERIQYQNFCNEKAKKDRLNKKLLHKDVYLYYLFENKNLSKKTITILEKLGVDKSNVIVNFNNVLLQNLYIAETLFSALRNVEELLPIDIGIRYMSAYNRISEITEIDKMSFITQKSYFEIIEKISKRCNVTEEYVAKKAVEIANKNGKDVSVVLFDYKNEVIKSVKKDICVNLKRKKSFGEIFYVLGIITLSAIFSCMLGVLLGSIIFGILSYIPILFIVENLLNYLLSFLNTEKTTLRMEYKNVPYERSTMVVVTEYICSIEQLKESIFHAKVLLEGNKDDNVSVGILIDTKSGEFAINELDYQIVEYLSQIELSNRINVFIRKKCCNNKKYVAKERKRGALMALNKFLITREDFEFFYVKDKNFITPRYVLALDADNTLLCGEVKKLVGMMAHPYNEKYDLIALHSKNNLYSLKTTYSKRFIDESGYENYPEYSGLYFRLFNKDVFCGKGIYNLKSFYNKLEDILPSNKILSHDILEGSILETGSGGMCFEDAPANFLSDRERRKRWQRGDVQLLPFLFGFWKSDGDIRCKKNISSIYFFVMFKNIIYNFKETCLLVLLLLGVINGNYLILTALGLFIVPYLINIIKILRQCANKVKLSYYVKNIGKNLILAIEDFFMIGYYGVSNLLLFISTSLRMLCKNKLLEWKTYYNTQNSRKFICYLQEMSIPFAVCTGIVSILCVLNFDMFFACIYLICFFCVFIELYVTSTLLIIDKKLDDDDKNLLKYYADLTYKYFVYMKNSNAIIADNFQLKPYKGISKSTSPTNIGFSILSEICAFYLKIISYEQCFFNIDEILFGIEKLEKWEGLLYNWYYVDSLKPCNNFISSVDNGNFLACLMVLKEFLKSNNEKAIVDRVDKIIDNSKLNKLYDKHKNLFYIGYDGKNFCGHYDLLASEARILSMIYVSLYNDERHFFALQKDYSNIGGNTLLSWSGTMFEMLMADIFFPLPKHSNVYKSCSNNVKIQIRNKIESLWGVSESGRYLFDEEMKYQYYPFGISTLSLNSEKSDKVISPYSSILALRYAPKDVIRNIKNIKDYGGTYEYGFYESIDFTQKGKIVYSSMSHHQGMILASITNFLCDNIIQKLMCFSPKIISTLNYYNEKQPIFNFSQKKLNKSKKTLKNDVVYYKKHDKIENDYIMAGICDTEYSIICNSIGGGISKNNDIFINFSTKDYFESSGFFFYAKGVNRIWETPTFLPFAKGIDDYVFEYTQREIFYRKRIDRLKLSITIIPQLNGEVRKLNLDNDYVSVAFFGRIILNSMIDYASHPCFNDMFISVKKVSNNVIIFVLNVKGQKSKNRCLAVRVEGLNNLKFICSREKFIGRDRDEFNPKILFSDNENIVDDLGNVLSPCVGFIGDVQKNENKECQVALIYGENEEKLIDTINSLPNDMYAYALQSKTPYYLSEFSQKILPYLTYMPYPDKVLNNVVESDNIEKFKKFINNKKTLLYIFDKKCIKNFNAFLNTIVELQTFNVKIKPCIYLSKNCSKNFYQYIEENLKKRLIDDYCIWVDNVEEKYWVFAKIDSELNFEYSLNYKPDKRFYALRNIYKCDYEIAKPNFILKSGNGGYIENGNYVHDGSITNLPYSYVLAQKYGGLVTTADGGGFFYFDNSRENKCVDFDNDYVSPKGGEYAYIKTANGYFSILGGYGNNRYTIFNKETVEYVVGTENYDVKTTVGILYDGKIKYSEIKIHKNTNNFSELIYAITPSLSWKRESEYITYNRYGNLIAVVNVLSGNKMYMRVIGGNQRNFTFDNNSKEISFEYYVENANEKITILFSKDMLLLQSLNESNLSILKAESTDYFSKINDVEINSSIKSFDFLVNFLPNQIFNSRINAKAGFYQVGGATGFRDQTQDCLAFFTKPEMLKEKIEELCMHQYEEGDVMHWWHNPKFGLRTKISDDKLFLPWIVCEYIIYSNDINVLKEEYTYLRSDKLSPYERDRLENPPYTDYKETVFKHCLRAIRSSLRYGENRLLIMGSGDWNDGMDAVCALGKGESVFNSMLCYKILMDFSAYCPEDLKTEMQNIATELKNSINLKGWEKDRYKRLYTDDGRWLGSEKSKTFQLDLLVQAFGVYSGVADGERINLCLNTAKSLIDKENGIVKLLFPSLTRKEYLGYISDYPMGVRENGGQYTHAVAWYLIALCIANRQDEAFDIFMMINPVEKCKSEEGNSTYKGEPYVLSGDVYSLVGKEGRMGWSWYTGSASWAYKLVVEYFYGIKKRGNTIYVEPKLPKKLINSSLTYKFGSSRYIFEYKLGLYDKITIDGEKIESVLLEKNVMKKILVEIGV